MTCIIGLAEHGVVYMGGDSAAVGDTSLVVLDNEKVFRNGEFLIGFTSSFRMGQLLRYRFEPPSYEESPGTVKGVTRFMMTDFIDGVRECLHEYGYSRTTDEGQHEGGEFLVGFRGMLFYVDVDYQVAIPRAPFYAVGEGADLALGAMSVSRGQRPKSRIRKALQASEDYCSTVRGPFRIRSI